MGARSWCACGCAGLAPQLTWASGYLPPRTLAPGPVGTSLFTLNARCDWGGREDLVKVLGEQGPGVVVIVGAPERVREHLDESRVLDGQPHRAFFPMDHLPSCGTAVYAGAGGGGGELRGAGGAAGGGGRPVVLVPADAAGVGGCPPTAPTVRPGRQ